MQPQLQGSGKPRGQQAMTLRDSCPFPLSQDRQWLMEAGGVVNVWNCWWETSGTLSCTGHRMPESHHSVELPVHFSLQPKLWLVRSSRSAPLASSPWPPPGHTGRIRTCRTEGRGSCLLDRSAVRSGATAHSSPMGSSMNDPAGTLRFPESHRFRKEIYDYRCSEGRNSLFEIFSFNDFLVLFSSNRRTPLHFLKYPICKNVEKMISCGVIWCSVHYWLLKFVIYSPCFSSLQEREMVTQEKQFIEVFLCKWISIMSHKRVAIALVTFWSISPQKELGINLGVKSHRILTVFMEYVKLLSS